MKDKTKHYRPAAKHRRRRGMALLVVLFIVAAVTSVSLGILYRADLAAAGGHNYALRTQADYIAWGGLEHARALILDNPENPDTAASFALDDDMVFFYTLSSLSEPDQTDPNRWRYDVFCEVFYTKSPLTQPAGKLAATVVYDPNAPARRAWLADIRRLP